MKRYDYGHLDEIKVCIEDQQLYMFKEGDFSRLRLQDTEDMLLLLVQQKLTNLMIDKRYDLNVALRMFTRGIVIQKRVEDLQLVMKILLLEYFATVSAKEFLLLSCSVAPAEEFALLDEDKDYSQSKTHYSQSKTCVSYSWNV
nr:hypothetical protein [Tanacetum cinerariifolium]